MVISTYYGIALYLYIIISLDLSKKSISRTIAVLALARLRSIVFTCYFNI